LILLDMILKNIGIKSKFICVRFVKCGTTKLNELEYIEIMGKEGADTIQEIGKRIL
jgi:hypothetical protein